MFRNFIIKILAKSMKEHHIVMSEIITENDKYVAYDLRMDCHVNPHKIVIITKDETPLLEGEVFDPHFTNPNVIARFSPNTKGIHLAFKLLAPLGDANPVVECECCHMHGTEREEVKKYPVCLDCINVNRGVMGMQPMEEE